MANFIFILSLTYLTVFICDCSQGIVNVALKKSTFSSSEATMFYSHYAADEKYNDFAFCFMSHSEDSPWWAVDLAGIYQIQYIYIVLPVKMDCCGNGMTDFTIFVGNMCPSDAKPVYEMCYYQKETLPQGSRLNITCNGNAQGRYVKIQLGNVERLFLSEVEVYANTAVIQDFCLTEMSTSNIHLSTLEIWKGSLSSLSDVSSELQYSNTDITADVHLQSSQQSVGDVEYSQNVVTVVSDYSQHLFSEASNYSSPVELTTNILNQTTILQTHENGSAIYASSKEYVEDTIVSVQPTSDVVFLYATNSSFIIESPAKGASMEDIFLSSTMMQTPIDLTTQLDSLATKLDRTPLQKFITEDLSFSSKGTYENYITYMPEPGYTKQPSLSAWKSEASAKEFKESQVESSFITYYYGSSGISQYKDLYTSHHDGEHISEVLRSSLSDANVLNLYSTDVIPVTSIPIKPTAVSEMPYMSTQSSSQRSYTHTPTPSGYASNTTQDYWNKSSLSQMSKTCKCRCRMLPGDPVLLQEMKENAKRLTLNPTHLSQQKRKKISIPDGRVSAQSIGYVGVLTLILVFGPHVVSDVFSVGRFVVVQIRDTAHSKIQI